MNPYEIHQVDTPRRLLCRMIACLRIEGVRSKGSIGLGVCESYIGKRGPVMRAIPRFVHEGEVDFSKAIVDAIMRLAIQHTYFYEENIPRETKEHIWVMQHVTSET